MKLSHTPSTCVSSNDIISAALLIVDTFNVALTHPEEWSVSDSKLHKRKVAAKLEDAGNVLDTIYSTIKTRDKIVKMQDILRNLGE
jgi:DNA replicative helicase MCM subunit Mcm2 (Cdc46/Mcm family)